MPLEYKCKHCELEMVIGTFVPISNLGSVITLFVCANCGIQCSLDQTLHNHRAIARAGYLLAKLGSREISPAEYLRATADLAEPGLDMSVEDKLFARPELHFGSPRERIPIQLETHIIETQRDDSIP
jgi:hypothetical protein